MAMRRIDPSAALRKRGASRKYFELQWRTFGEFGLSEQSLYSTSPNNRQAKSSASGLRARNN